MKNKVFLNYFLQSTIRCRTVDHTQNFRGLKLGPCFLSKIKQSPHPYCTAMTFCWFVSIVMILTVRYFAYLPSAGINVQAKRRISDETSEDISQITFVVIEVKRERFVYMLQTVIEHFENSESCESAHSFLSAAYEIKRVTYKSVRFDYRVRACLCRLIFLSVHNSRLYSGVPHHRRSNRTLSRFWLICCQRGKMSPNHARNSGEVGKKICGHTSVTSLVCQGHTRKNG